MVFNTIMTNSAWSISSAQLIITTLCMSQTKV